MRTAIRVKALTAAALTAAEKHGKREDFTSVKRRVRDAPPIVHNTLNLRDAFDEHVADARVNKGAKNIAQHALIQFPTELNASEKSQRAMLKIATDFINRTYGGNAVFAARLDRDEAGEHTVDVFFAPKYKKQTAKTRRGEAEPVEWISQSKHGKELCEKHREEIEERHGGKFTNGPRQIGISLQSEWRHYLAELSPTVASRLKDKRLKEASAIDRVEPEVFKMQQDRSQLDAERGQIEKLKIAASQAHGRARKYEAAASALHKEKQNALNEVKTIIEQIKARFAKMIAPRNIKEKAAKIKHTNALTQFEQRISKLEDRDDTPSL